MSAPIDIVGKRFGRLIAVGISDHCDSAGNRQWVCLCDCGCEVVTATGSLTRKVGGTRSCGCLRSNGAPTPQRFAKYTRLDAATGCVLWVGRLDEWGYGEFRVGHRHYGAHRIAWLLAGRSLPADGRQLLHSCDVANCVNVDHLSVGTNAQNSNDMAVRWRGVRSRHGLPYGAVKSGRRFISGTRILGRYHYLGTYDTAEEASTVAVRYKQEKRAGP